MPAQLPLPLEGRSALTRSDFIVAPGNAEAVRFIESWPDWPVQCAGIFGPPGCGKSHLVAIWLAMCGGQAIPASQLSGSVTARLDRSRPIAVEDVDSSLENPARDAVLFALLEGVTPQLPILLTGREPPATWKTVLPDLASRFGALLAFPVWEPDDTLLKGLARKLFADRQLQVPDGVIALILNKIERSPAALRAFVSAADERALAEGRSVNLSLVREMLSTSA